MQGAEVELEARRLEDRGGQGEKVQFISAATGEVGATLLGSIIRVLSDIPKEELDESLEAEPMHSRPQQSVAKESVWRDAKGVFVVESEAMERLTAMADTRDQRVLLQLWREMRRSGMADRLINAGIEAGDTIRFGKVEVEWF